MFSTVNLSRQEIQRDEFHTGHKVFVIGCLILRVIIMAVTQERIRKIMNIRVDCPVKESRKFTIEVEFGSVIDSLEFETKIKFGKCKKEGEIPMSLLRLIFKRRKFYAC